MVISHGVRDLEIIDSELRFLSRVLQASRVFNGQLGEPWLTAGLIDRLLDERASAECQGAKPGTASP